MPRLVDTHARTDLVIRAIDAVLAEHGIPGLTMRAIAAGSLLSPAALHEHFGSRERLLQVTAHWAGKARLDRLETMSRTRGIAAFLPTDDDDVVATRAWLGWCELARSADWLSEIIHDIAAEERHLLARAVDHDLDRDRLDLLTASVDGLRWAVCSPIRPMSPARARRLLAMQVAGVDRAA